MFELVNAKQQAAIIKVIGVGGGGCNAIEHMQQAVLEDVDLIAANTDIQALERSTAKATLRLGGSITRGLGAGADPDVGRRAALEDRDSIMGALEGADMVFIAAGMGGGTGTGASPVVAQIAKESGILTVAVVTRPFDLEGRKRAQVAEEGIRELSQYADSLIIIPNQKLLSVLGPETSVTDAFAMANEVLTNAVQGISEVVTRAGMVNVDFADVRTVMSEMGGAMMGSGKAIGEDRAQRAVDAAISSPLLEETRLAGAHGILINMTASKLLMGEIEAVGEAIQRYASENANIVTGMVIDPAMGDEMRITIVATGIERGSEKAAPHQRSVRPVVAGEGIDYDALDNPSLLRSASRGEPVVEDRGDLDTDLLDVPAFLRRQVD